MSYYACCRPFWSQPYNDYCYCDDDRCNDPPCEECTWLWSFEEDQ
jgi:hypothetical protein